MKQSKKRVSTAIIVFVLILAFAGCSPQNLKSSADGRRSGDLQQAIDYLLADPNLQNAMLAVYIESLDNGRVLYHRNEHKLFIPASNMKLFTTAASLEKLGADFRFKTEIYTDGVLQDSVLHGNMIVRGSGDPTISGRMYDQNMFAVFQAWADSLKKKGIRRIKGDLIGDNSYFTDAPMAEGWNWDDEPFWYSARTSALSFNDNCVDVTVTAAPKSGQPVSVQIQPQISGIAVISTAKTVTDSVSTIYVDRLRAQDTIYVSGNLPVHKKQYKESITVERPAEFFMKNLRRVLEKRGLQVDGQLRIIDYPRHIDYTKRTLLFATYSVPLKDIVHVLNKISHNFYAEQLLKTLGAIYGHDGSFKTGARVVTDWLKSIGVAPEQFIMVDGSGLSRKNYVAPAATATLLRRMYGAEIFDIYFDSLPVSGADGTLKKRMKHMQAAARIHAKTGTMGHVRNLSGYAFDTGNHPYLFVLMANNYSVQTSYINVLYDRICNIIANQ